MPRRAHKRSVRLVRPGLQLRLILSFLGLAGLALALQFVLFMSALGEAALLLPNDGPLLLARSGEILLGVFLTTLALLLPTLFAVGLVMTHRIAGPIHHFEAYLSRLLRGEPTEALRLRRGDELQELAGLIERATAELRAATPPAGADLPAVPGGSPAAEPRAKRERPVEAA